MSTATVTSPPINEEIYLAGIEGGGTTFVVSIARVVPIEQVQALGNTTDDLLQIGPTHLQILQTTTIPPKNNETGEILNFTPAQILNETCTFLKKHLPSSGKYSAVGIATFGPAGVDRTQTHNYGTILSGSPKKEWRGVDLLTPIATACGLDANDIDKVGFDTDVNAPALAEFRHRCYLQEQDQHEATTLPFTQVEPSSKPLTSLSYITIGTGVGVGLVLNSQSIHGLLHPEGGHVAIQPLEGDTFQGYSWGVEKSPYAGVGTVEGVTSSVALTERYLQMEREEKQADLEKVFGTSTAPDADKDTSNAQTREVLSTLSDTHPLWNHAANAIANLCVSLLLLTSCQKIVLGGGIMKRTILYQMVRQRTCQILNGYLDSVDELSSEMKLKDVIVPSSWEQMGSGLVGAFALALDAHEKDGNANGLEAKETPVNSTKNNKVDECKKKDGEQRMFTSGVLAGIGLSFGCILLTSLIGRGHRHRY